MGVLAGWSGMNINRCLIYRCMFHHITGHYRHGAAQQSKAGPGFWQRFSLSGFHLEVAEEPAFQCQSQSRVCVCVCCGSVVKEWKLSVC